MKCVQQLVKGDVLVDRGRRLWRALLLLSVYLHVKHRKIWSF